MVELFFGYFEISKLNQFSTELNDIHIKNRNLDFSNNLIKVSYEAVFPAVKRQNIKKSEY
jgi:hypothetical protein